MVYPTKMALPLNRNPPETMWIDMNSSFARTEQQAHVLMRDKPVGVGKYTTPNGPVISPSTEAKKLGIKTAHTVRDCKLLCPEIVIVKSDPPKYREMHRRLVRIFREWSPDVLGKSIDEACICFERSPALKRYTMEEIALKIKQQIRERCGSYITVSIGIGTNQFLAKTAAGLVKPDGLSRIDHANLRQVYSQLALTDLCGINTRNEARLNMGGIYTPLDFLEADPHYLQQRVFGSILGHYWSLMLRGFEYQKYEGPERRTFGNSHSIREQTADPRPNLGIVCTLCDKASRRMRRDRFSCRSVSVLLVYLDGTHFKKRMTIDTPLYTTGEVFRIATLLFNRQPRMQAVHKIGVRLSLLEPGAQEQMNLFDDPETKRRRSMDAVDRLNDRYGEQVVYLAPMHGAKNRIDDSISFGSTGDVEDLYAEEDSFPVIDAVPDDYLLREWEALDPLAEVDTHCR